LFGAPQLISTAFASWLRYCTDVSQPNFARCLAVFCAGTLCMHFWGLLPPNGIYASCNIQFPSNSCVFLNWQCYCMALEHWHQPKFAAWYKQWNYGTFPEGTTYIRKDGHHVGHRPTFQFRCALLGGFASGARVALLWQHNVKVKC